MTFACFILTFQAQKCNGAIEEHLIFISVVNPTILRDERTHRTDT